jgi:thiol-disulfide isomerase/thioredoxin
MKLLRLVSCVLALVSWTPMHGAFAQERMPELNGAVAWINSKPLTLAELRGKVVLLDIWTFTCVNWQRTLPYVNAWAAKYKDHGLVVIGVHSPEFSFERDLDNVREATGQLKVGFPVAVDSRFAIWNALRNEAWPALYFVDEKGVVRDRHYGEGDFERSERTIQRLLVEAGAKNVPMDLVRVEGTGAQAPADWAHLRTPETYTGYEKTEGFSSPGGMLRDRRRMYALPDRLGSNAWAASGEWTFGGEAARAEGANARIVYRFHARDVNLVMGAMSRGTPVAFQVRIDGQAPGAAHGSDVDASGRGMLVEKRLYQLIRQPGGIEDRQFEIEFLQPGGEAYVFTFG